MQRAGQKRPVSVRAIPAAAPKSIAVAEEQIEGALLPVGAAIGPVCTVETDERVASHRSLEIAIQQRIEARLPGRVRNLRVHVFENVVTLEGQCATYYTKQLAQHAVMAIIEDEHLENAIVVSVQQ